MFFYSFLYIPSTGLICLIVHVSTSLMYIMSTYIFKVKSKKVNHFLAIMTKKLTSDNNCNKAVIAQNGSKRKEQIQLKT